ARDRDLVHPAGRALVRRRGDRRAGTVGAEPARGPPRRVAGRQRPDRRGRPRGGRRARARPRASRPGPVGGEVRLGGRARGRARPEPRGRPPPPASAAGGTPERVTPGTAARPARVAWPWTRRGALGLLLAWAAGHVLLRLALSSALTVDDAREAVLGQSFEWGYQARQPPLYDWLVWAVFRLLGPGVMALTVLKYALLVLTFWLVYLTARRLLADPRLATLATFSFLLVIPVSWNVHEALTHTITVLAACAGAAYLLVRLPERPTPGMYAALGAALGLGALSKFTFVVFAAALLGAALLVDRFRPRLLTPRLGLALLVAGALVLPYALWFVGHGHDLGRLYAREVRLDEGDPWLAEAGAGLYYVARIALYYLGPLALLLGACFPGL